MRVRAHMHTCTRTHTHTHEPHVPEDGCPLCTSCPQQSIHPVIIRERESESEKQTGPQACKAPHQCTGYAMPKCQQIKHEAQPRLAPPPLACLLLAAAAANSGPPAASCAHPWCNRRSVGGLVLATQEAGRAALEVELPTLQHTHTHAHTHTHTHARARRYTQVLECGLRVVEGKYWPSAHRISNAPPKSSRGHRIAGTERR